MVKFFPDILEVAALPLSFKVVSLVNEQRKVYELCINQIFQLVFVMWVCFDSELQKLGLNVLLHMTKSRGNRRLGTNKQ